MKSVHSFPVSDWYEYTQLLGEVFDDPMAELMKIRQIGYVEEYHEAFNCIIPRLQLSDDNILSCFLGGLKEGDPNACQNVSTKFCEKGLYLS